MPKTSNNMTNDLDSTETKHKNINIPWLTLLFLVFVFFMYYVSNRTLDRLYDNNSLLQKSLIDSYIRNLNYKDSIFEEKLFILLDTNKFNTTTHEKKEIIELLRDKITDDIDNNNLSLVKYTLDSQLSRIQNEYETLALWCGIITIVFLIFSFYSLFKTEDFTKQAREVLQDLRLLKKDAENEKNGIDEKIRSSNQDIDTKIRTVDDRLKLITDESDKLVKSFSDQKDDVLKRIDAFVKDVILQINGYKSDKMISIEDELKSIESRIDVINSKPITQEDLDNKYKESGLDLQSTTDCS